MSDIIGTIFNAIFSIMGLGIILLIVIRTLIATLTKEKAQTATVVNKQCLEKQIYPKAQAPYLRKEYLVTFLCGTKKRTFCVSALSYHDYTTGQTGCLTYKGRRLIDFH